MKLDRSYVHSSRWFSSTRSCLALTLVENITSFAYRLSLSHDFFAVAKLLINRLKQ